MTRLHLRETRVSFGDFKGLRLGLGSAVIFSFEAVNQGLMCLSTKIIRYLRLIVNQLKNQGCLLHPIRMRKQRPAISSSFERGTPIVVAVPVRTFFVV